MSRPSIDHTILSPSGRVSKRARAAALKREADRLFPPGYWDFLNREQTLAEKAQQLRTYAKVLLDLADRGMQPRKHRKAAAAIEAQAAALEAGAVAGPTPGAA